MNFRSWPNEFRLTELHGSKRISFDFFSLISLSLYAQSSGKWEILSQMRFFFFLLYFGYVVHVAPCVSPCSGPFLLRNNLFHPCSSLNYLIQNLFKLLPNFKDFLQKSRFWGHLEKREIPTISEFDEYFLGN